MRSILSERNVVIVLFVLVFIAFSFAHEDSKKMEQVRYSTNAAAISSFVEVTINEIKEKPVTNPAVLPASYHE